MIKHWEIWSSSLIWPWASSLLKGVAIGLALIVKNQFQGLGPEINETGMTMGDHIGNIVFTTITATSVIFEIIGPIAARYALRKSGETNV